MEHNFPRLRIVYSQIFLTNVLRLLDELRMSRAELSERSGVSEGYISDVVNAKANPSLRVMESLAQALGTPLTVLLEFTDLDEASLNLLSEDKPTRPAPDGYIYMGALLTAYQAFTVREWDRENKQVVTGKKSRKKR